MEFKKQYFKAEHLFRLGAALYVVGTSIYDIKEDLTALKKEHGLLIIGCVSLVKTLLEMRKKIMEIKVDVKDL